MTSASFRDQRPTERVSQAALTIEASDGKLDFEGVRTRLLGWLREKIRTELPTAMARGETDTLDHVDTPRTETVLLTAPLYWVLRNDDPDASYPQQRGL